MPFVHVRSLPFERPLDVASVLQAVAHDLAAATGVAARHVTATWSFLAPGHYAVGGEVATHQPEGSHPVLVELLAPDLHPPESVETMLATVAQCIARSAGVPLENVFVHYRAVPSGTVFDGGEIVRW